MCSYANYPHPNVLPSMPTRKKGGAKQPTAGGGETGMVNGHVPTGEETRPVPPTRGGENGGGPAPPPPKVEGVVTNSIEVQTEIKLFPGVLSRKHEH